MPRDGRLASPGGPANWLRRGPGIQTAALERGMPLREPTPEPHRGPTSRLDALQGVAAVLGLAAMAVYRVSGAVVDPDLWHEMALFREALALGPCRSATRSPTRPRFPSVHHEWGAGAIGYGVARWFDGSGLVALRYALLFGLLAICWKVNRARAGAIRRRRADGMLALLLVDAGFSTVRAQMYSFVLLAALLYLLERDRRGAAAGLPLARALRRVGEPARRVPGRGGPVLPVLARAVAARRAPSASPARRASR